MIDTVVDKSIDLRRYESIQFQLGNFDLIGEVLVFFDWMPNPRIKIYLKAEGKDISSIGNPIFNDSSVLRIPSKNISIQVRHIRLNVGEQRLEGVFLADKDWQIFADGIDESSSLSSAEFYLPNFHLKREALVSIDGWHIKITPVAESEKTIKSLKLQGGYAITHHAEIIVKDEKILTVKRIASILEGIYYFFSFARGFWTYPVLFRGYNDKKELIWEDYNISQKPMNTQSTDWQNVATWLDAQDNAGLEELSEKFFRKWLDERWYNSLRTAIYWYINANIGRRGIEGAIIQNQAAFELISWHVFVEIRKALSEEGFKKLPAHDKIRLLLSETCLPNEVPQSLKHLYMIVKGNKNLVASKIITEIRNKLVHPKKEDSSKEIGDCWTLAQWALSLVILNLLGYSGNYRNRLSEERREGRTEEVPWNKTSN